MNLKLNVSLDRALRKIEKTRKITQISKPFGVLNHNWVLWGEGGESYVLRIPKKNPKQQKLIKEEYQEISYAKDGSEYRFRTLDEQVTFMEECQQWKIPIVPIAEKGKHYLLLEYINGKPLSEFLAQTDYPTILSEHFTNITRAHNLGIILGDRWGPNEIVTPSNKLVYIDFDIALIAEDAKEFEIAQVIYHCILQSKNKKEATAVAKKIVSGEQFLYNKERVAEFLRGHVKYFAKRKCYCSVNPRSIERKISDLLVTLHEQ